MEEIKVFGHKSPDTDSIVSAIVFAWYLNEIKNRPTKPYRLGELNRETKYVLKRFEFTTPRLISRLKDRDNVVIVDTNNPKELIDLGNAQILEILDHHKLTGGINSIEPLNITIRRTASAATVVYLRMKDRGTKAFPRKIAGLILAGIISDSANFTSPVTTDTDIKVAKRLAKKYDFDIEKLAYEMFEHKSNLSRLSARKVALSDSKLYDLNGRIVRICIVETTKPELVFRRESDLKEELIKLRNMENLNEIYLFVFDLINKQAILIAPDSEMEEIVKSKFKTTEVKGRTILPGVLSRKKQLVPGFLR